MNGRFGEREFQLAEVKTADDFSSAFPLLLALMLEEDPEEANKLTKDACYKSWQKSKEQGYLLYCCICDGHAIAVFGLQALHDPVSIKPYFRINNLIVAKPHRGQGLGTTLFKMIDRIISERGGEEVLLEVLDTNEKAKDLYGKLGYEYVCNRMWKRL